MGIMTLRLNEKEEKMLSHLQAYFDEDKAKILKGAMHEKFEDLRDREVIEEYESKLKTKKVQFESGDDIIKEIKKKNTNL